MFNLFRFSFLVLLCIVVLTTCRADGECATSGECPNPEAQEVAEEVVEEVVAPEAGDPQCPTRAHVVYCAGKHLDTNQNGKLDRPELESAIDKLPWYGRGILQILGSVDKMMKKCDMDGDDAISMDYDMEKNKDQCLATCFKRRAFKGAFFPDCE